MEVKIKNADGSYSAAEWTIENGVMIVSPKVEKFEPKDGDIVYVKSSCENIIIYKENGSEIGRYVNLSDNEYFYTDNNVVCSKDSVKEIRYATEAEKKLLFDKIEAKGYEWLADERKLVKKKWKPMAGQGYYIPAICNAQFKAVKEDWSDDDMDVLYFNKGWVFCTEEECQKFCDKLNEAISSIKP